MNKKIVTLLIVLIAAVSIASVCAAELTKVNDFDGKFKMNITGNDTVKGLTDSLQNSNNGGNTYQSQSAWTVNDGVSVYYYNGAINSVVSTLKSNSAFMDNPKVEGNLTILEDTTSPEGASYALKYFVGVQSPDNSTTVFVGSNDLNLAKEYANTIGF